MKVFNALLKILFPFFGLASGWIYLEANQFSAPIHSNNIYVNQIIFYRPYPQSALISKEKYFNIDLSQSNIFQVSKNIETDFGLTSLEFTFTTPLVNNTLELSINYPLYYVSTGFMDNLLDLSHHTLGQTTTRETRGHINNHSTYKIGTSIDRSGNYFASGNPQIELKLNLLNKRRYALSINSGIKIPIGQAKDGFTTEKIDFMIGTQFQKEFDNFLWTTNFSITYNNDYVPVKTIKHEIFVISSLLEANLKVLFFHLYPTIIRTLSLGITIQHHPTKVKTLNLTLTHTYFNLPLGTILHQPSILIFLLIRMLSPIIMKQI